MKDMFDLTGKVAIVTGGNGGIGLGMAKGLAAHGAAVVVAGRNAAKTEAAVKELVASGAKASGFAVDVRKEDQVRAMVTRLTKAVADTDHAADALAAAICHASAGPLQAAIGVRRGR